MTTLSLVAVDELVAVDHTMMRMLFFVAVVEIAMVAVAAGVVSVAAVDFGFDGIDDGLTEAVVVEKAVRQIAAVVVVVETADVYDAAAAVAAVDGGDSLVGADEQIAKFLVVVVAADEILFAVVADIVVMVAAVAAVGLADVVGGSVAAESGIVGDVVMRQWIQLNQATPMPLGSHTHSHSKLVDL